MVLIGWCVTLLVAEPFWRLVSCMWPSLGWVGVAPTQGLIGWVAERVRDQEEGEHLLRLSSSFGTPNWSRPHWNYLVLCKS